MILRALAFVFISLLVRLQLQAEPTPVSPDYVIKAAYIYNFAMFVEWPADAFVRPDSPFVIGIIGTDRFGSALDEIVRDKRLNNRRFVVKRLQNSQDAAECHILFVHSGEVAKIVDIVDQLRRSPVLLVGDTPEFTRGGGMINFAVVDNKIRCEISVSAAKRARLAISSKLLSLARVIDGVR